MLPFYAEPGAPSTILTPPARTPRRDVHQIAHDVLDLEVLGRVDARHAGRQQLLRVLGRDDAADHDRHVADAELAHPAQHLLDQRHVRAGEDREADDVHALLERGVDDARGREADALVDDLDAGIARAHGDLLGAVAMAVEAGLADQDLEAAAEPGARRPRPRARTGGEHVGVG